jgi:hypothetical protein
MYLNSPTYRNATAIANHLMTLILASNACSVDLAGVVREWRELENIKREWRGMPRLSVHSLKEIAAAKREEMKTVSATTFEEVDDEPSKESISIQTVPTPPTGDDPSAPCVRNDK